MNLGSSLIDEASQIDLGELEAAAVEAKGYYGEILSLRRNLFNAIVLEGADENESSDKEVKKAFDALMIRCSDALDVGPKSIPDDIKKEKRYVCYSHKKNY